jgi:signal transduction histidine kinase
MAENIPSSNEIRQAFWEYDRTVIQANVKVGCLIGVVLMPVGVILDWVVYGPQRPEVLKLFLHLRLLCSLCIIGLWPIVASPFGKQHARKLGVSLAMLPTFFLSCMVYYEDGSRSTYYAGLNLVLLVIGFVLYWTFLESLVAVSLVIAMYISACWLSAVPVEPRMLLNNLYFLVLSGVVVMTGSYFHSKARFREFSLRYELDRSRTALEESNQKLLELDQIKNRFFANISHELRTPLTLLLAPLETLLHRHQKALDEESRQMLVTMHSNGMRLLKLINDLLDLVRLESGRLQVKHEPVEVSDFVRGIASAARQVADDKGLKLEVSTDPALGTLLSDRDKLEKIVLNLVFNALKFTPSGGCVSLRAELRGERFAMIVADTGMGISQKNLPHVFDRFWQADGASNRKYQGVGIGLALVKELVEVQGGTVGVESEEGRGTVFTVSLPFEAAPATVPSPSSAVAQSGAGAAVAGPAGTVTSEEWLANLYRRAELFPALTPVKDSPQQEAPSAPGALPTILIADDEPDMRGFMRSQLSADYRVLEAADGQQAVEKAAQFLPDLILMDMMMPGKDGIQASREIRAEPATELIPIVMLTARADEETKLAALSAGASDFLAKPFSTTELRVRLRNLLQSHQYQSRLTKQNQVLETTIEQLKETETQLVQTEKLASLGRMSAGIIHEINNPLNFTTTGLYTLHKKTRLLPPEEQPEYEEILRDVEDGVKRVKTIVSELRMFTHPETESREAVDLGVVVAVALRFLSNEWKEKVVIEKAMPEGQTVWANKNKLIHVLVNLLQNAIDALGAKAFADPNEKPTIRISGRLEGDKSLLILRDNGTGIDAAHVDKIFDPFYTTKDVGKGMGLGLAICYRIVKECEGRITVSTEPGKFCEFTLEFPAKG